MGGMTAAVAASALPGARSGLLSGVKGVMQKEERIDIIPSYPACSTAKENCMQTGCCQTSGHTCFRKNEHMAFCNETLYCFSLYSKDSGSTKPNYELDLLQKQHEHHVSLFACDGWDVFSDVQVEIGGGYLSHKVEDTFGEFHRIKRKTSGTWVNWGIFYKVWEQVRNLGHWESKSWTVKVDADAVFLPNRLSGWLSGRSGESPHGIYFENCKNVQYGFFGNLEVMSHEATNVLTKYLEDCHAAYAPCADEGCDWQYGAWGEDVFVQRCLDRHYVDKVEAFDLTNDGACPADRPASEKHNKKWHAESCSDLTTATVHPFKTPKAYFACLSEMTNIRYD